MKSFFKLAGISLQSQMYYRAGFVLNLFTPLVLLFGQFLLWNALYGGVGEIAGYTRSAMFTYMLFSFCINNLLTWSSENILSREIRTGAVVSRCIKPVGFLNQSLAAMAGAVVPQAAVNFAIGFVILAVFKNRFMLPDSANVLPFVLSLLPAIVLRMLLVHVFSLLCFYTTSHLGISWTRTALMEFFSGAIVPIAVFPAWLRTISYYLPFPFMIQMPLSILLGQELPLPLFMTYLMQLVWIAVLLLAHALIYGHVRKNMSFAGG